MTDQELYITTARKTRVQLTPRQQNKYMDENIKREIEKKYAGKFFSYGYVRPGTIKVLPREIGNKNGCSDFTGNMIYDVIFQCETFLPQVGQELIARVRSINRVGILARSENNKVIILLTKDNDIQSSPELFDEVRLGNRVRVKILSYKIDSQAGSIIVIGDLMEVMTKIYQSYQFPGSNEALLTSLRGQIEFTNQFSNLYLNYDNWQIMKNSKNQINPYFIPEFSSLDVKSLKSTYSTYKNSWSLTRSLIDESELVHPRNYNKNKGVAIVPFKARAVTRAYFKMWEILNRYKNIVSNLDAERGLTVLALAEGPGSFIQAFSHYRKVNYQSPPDTILGYTLETKIPYLRWDWNMSQKELGKLGQNLHLNYQDMTSKEAPLRIAIDLEKQGLGKVDFVMADGAIEDAGGTSYMEIMNYRLFLGEIFSAMLNSKPGANFVLKVFDLLTKVSYQMLRLLSNYYDEVHVTKPNFSRPASSERYVVCLGFKGFPEDEEESMTKMFIHILNELEKKVGEKQSETYLVSIFNILIGEMESDEFHQKLQEINKDHTQVQSDFISRGIHLIHTQQMTDQKVIKDIKQEQVKHAIQWCKNHNMEYQSKVDLSDEKLAFPGKIVAEKMIQFSMNPKSLNPNVLKHFLENYQYMSFENMEELLRSLQERGDVIFQDENQAQLFQIKTRDLSPFDQSDEFNSKFFTAFEIMNQFPELTSKKEVQVHCHHDYTGEVIRGINQYLQSQKIKYDWTVSADPQNKTEDEEVSPFYQKYGSPSGKRWLFEKTLDFTSSDFIEQATLPKLADLIWMDEEFPNESEFESFGSLYGQILFALKNLNESGNIVFKQWTFFRKISRSLIALLMVLFKEVKLVKPLASPKESSELYVVCMDFQASNLKSKLLKELINFQGDLNEYIENDDPNQPGGHLPNLMDVHLSPELGNVLRFYSHYLIVLNMIPKLQIDLDIHHNPVYALNKVEQASLEVLQGSRQQEINNIVDLKQRAEEQENLYAETDKLFQSIRKSVNQDFSYLVNLKKKWDTQNAMPSIKADQKL